MLIQVRPGRAAHERGGIDAELRQRARAGALDDDVGAGDEPGERGATRRGREIERDALLAGVQEIEEARRDHGARRRGGGVLSTLMTRAPARCEQMRRPADRPTEPRGRGRAAARRASAGPWRRARRRGTTAAVTRRAADAAATASPSRRARARRAAPRRGMRDGVGDHLPGIDRSARDLEPGRDGREVVGAREVDGDPTVAGAQQTTAGRPPTSCRAG